MRGLPPQVLIPRRSLTGPLPSLLARLDQMPDYSTFRASITVSTMHLGGLGQEGGCRGTQALRVLTPSTLTP